jgi:hypothetical protein
MPFCLIMNRCRLNLNFPGDPDSEMGILLGNIELNIWVSNRFVPGTVSTVP